MNPALSNKALSRILTVPLVVACIGGGVALIWMLSRPAGLTRPARDENRAELPAQPRHSLDDSGYTLVSTDIPPWDDPTSLEEARAAFHEAGYRQLPALNAELARTDLTTGARVTALINKALVYLDEGEPRRASEELVRARTVAESHPILSALMLSQVIFLQGLAGLRQGETDNCVLCRRESSCILPIGPTAVHKEPAGARLAFRHFTEYLRRHPDDLGVRWLLNLAHMTLGDYPGGLAPEHLLALNRFRSEPKYAIGAFKDIAPLVGVNRLNMAGGAIMEDFDNDGLLDIVVSSMDTAMPLAFYRNKGDGTFEEVAQSAGVAGDSKQCKGASWGDFDGDGWPDLLVNYLNAPPQLFRNNRDGTFTDVAAALGVVAPTVGFSCWFWDYDNDGWLDIYASAYERKLDHVVLSLLGEPHTAQTGRLYRNVAGKRFQDVTREAGLDLVTVPMGSNFGDFDNDGYLITIPSRTGHLQKGHAVACGDWRRCGSVDLFVQMGGATPGDRFHNVLFQNPGQGNHSLTVKLVGTKTNRAAIGARIKAVTAGDSPLTVYRHVTSGSSFGANPLEQTIGLGKATQVATLEIHWPTSGTTQVFHDVPVNQFIEVTEFASSYRAIQLKRVPVPE